MAFSIGRAGLTLALYEPRDWRMSTGSVSSTGTASGTSMSVTVTGGLIVPGSVTDSIRLRDQLLGYLGNGDEPIVPVISAAQPRDTGYYRITGVDVTTDMNAVLTGLHTYTVTMEPVFGYAQPMFESIITGALATNAIGAVSSDVIRFHSVPSAVTEYFKGVGGANYTRSSADGNLRWFTGGAASDTARFGLLPANYYIGAATFEQGNPYQPIIGRQLAQNDTVNWRLSNGLVRVTPNATAGKFDVSHWKGAAWAAAKTYQISGGTAGLVNGFSSITVLRNSPEEVVIRLGCTVVFGIDWGRVFIDLALRRGDRIVRGYLSADAQSNYKIARSTTEAATAITYGAVTLGNIRATANDADGNRYVLMSIGTATPISDLVNGAITQNAATQATMDFGIGSEVGGSGAVLPDDAVSIAQEYLSVQSEKQQTVAR